MLLYALHKYYKMEHFNVYRVSYHIQYLRNQNGNATMSS